MLAAAPTRVVYAGTSSPSTGPFAIAFGEQAIPYFDHTHIHAEIIDHNGSATALVEGSDYTLSGSADSDGYVRNGTLTLASGLITPNILVIWRAQPLDQSANLTDPNYADAVATQRALDRITAQMQEVADDLSRAPKGTRAHDMADLPYPAAGQALRWKGDLSGLENAVIPTDLAGLANAIAQVEGIEVEAEASSTAAAASAATASAAASAAVSSATTAASASAAGVAAVAAAVNAVYAAISSAGIYASTSAGISGTTNGQYFWVPVSTDTITLYKNVSGVATETLSLASQTSGVNSLNYNEPRFATEVASGLRMDGADLQSTWELSLRAATRDPVNGMITIPPGDYIATQTRDNPTTGVDVTIPYFCYVTAGRADTGTNLRLVMIYNGFQTGPVQTLSRPAPGSAKLAFFNDNGSGSPLTNGWVVRIYNDGTDPITIYKPELYTVDSRYFPRVVRYDDFFPVPPSRPVRNVRRFWETWGSAGRLARHRSERSLTYALDSVNGSSGNAGTLYAPKQLMANLATLTDGQSVGLYRGGEWHEVAPIPSGSVRGIGYQDVQDGEGCGLPLPIINALDRVATLSWTNNGDGTYTYSWTDANISLDSPAPNGYNNIFGVQINLATESLPGQFLSSRYRFLDVFSTAAVKATPGSQYLEDLGSNNFRITIQLTDGSAPGTNYRVEVVARSSCVVWNPLDRDGFLSGVMLIGANQGYGSLTGPNRFVGDRLVVVHGTTHGAVINGGDLRRFLFAGDVGENGPRDADSIGMVFYTSTDGLTWHMSEGAFYGNWLTAFYSHTSGQTFKHGEAHDVLIVGPGRGTDGSLRGNAFGSSSQTKNVFRRFYVSGYRDIGPWASSDAEVHDCIFDGVGRIAPPNLLRNSIARVVNPSSDIDKRIILPVYNQPVGSVIENCLFYLQYEPTGVGDNGAHVYGTNPAGTIRKSIFLVSQAVGCIMANLTLAPAFTANDNIIIVCGAFNGATQWDFPNAAHVMSDWDSYQSVTGQDTRSRFFDLRSDPRGEYAVFADPANTNFNWAQTAIAAQIRAACEELGAGPDWITSERFVPPTPDRFLSYIATAS